MEDLPTRTAIRELEKKYKCDHTFLISENQCRHTALVCMTCGLHIDNLMNRVIAENEVLRIILDTYEREMSIHNIDFTSHKHMFQDGILDLYLKEKVNQYISKRRRSDDL